MTFTVSPSADDPSSFIATAAAPDAQHYARNLILTAISNAAATRQGQQQQAAQQQARAHVLAVANPKWLLGSWLPVELEAYGCDKGYEFVFFPKHSFEAYQIAGLWMLDADKLHIDARGANDSLNLTGTITAADPTSFTLIDTTGKTIIFHRCRDDRPTVIESMNSTEGLDTMTPEEAAPATSGQ